MSHRFEDVQLIGDELHLDGSLVAILVEGPGDAQRGRFEDLFRFGEDEADDCGCPVRLHHKECEYHKAEDGTPPSVGREGDGYDEALADVAVTAKEYAKGGLLRMSDLATIIRKLKEDEA